MKKISWFLVVAIILSMYSCTTDTADSTSTPSDVSEFAINESVSDVSDKVSEETEASEKTEASNTSEESDISDTSDIPEIWSPIPTPDWTRENVDFLKKEFVIGSVSDFRLDDLMYISEGWGTQWEDPDKKDEILINCLGYEVSMNYEATVQYHYETDDAICRYRNDSGEYAVLNAETGEIISLHRVLNENNAEKEVLTFEEANVIADNFLEEYYGERFETGENSRLSTNHIDYSSEKFQFSYKLIYNLGTDTFDDIVAAHIYMDIDKYGNLYNLHLTAPIIDAEKFVYYDFGDYQQAAMEYVSELYSTIDPDAKIDHRPFYQPSIKCIYFEKVCYIGLNYQYLFIDPSGTTSIESIDLYIPYAELE